MHTLNEILYQPHVIYTTVIYGFYHSISELDLLLYIYIYQLSHVVIQNKYDHLYFTFSYMHIIINY